MPQYAVECLCLHLAEEVVAMKRSLVEQFYDDVSQLGVECHLGTVCILANCIANGFCDDACPFLIRMDTVGEESGERSGCGMQIHQLPLVACCNLRHGRNDARRDDAVVDGPSTTECRCRKGNNHSWM